MPTTLYYTDTLSALTISGVVVRSLSTTRGSGVITKTDASASGLLVYVTDNGTTELAFAFRVAAYTSTTGTWTHNHWGLESNAMANFSAGLGFGSERRANDGSYIAIVGPAPVSTTEYGTAAAARQFSGSGFVSTFSDGDWIVVYPDHGQTGGTAAAGYTLSFSYNGTTGAADGDSFVTLPDTVTAFARPFVSPYLQLLAQ